MDYGRGESNWIHRIKPDRPAEGVQTEGFQSVTGILKNRQDQNILLHAYYFDSGDINSVRDMGLFCAEIPSKV
jgi:hypothetical protein